LGLDTPRRSLSRFSNTFCVLCLLLCASCLAISAEKQTVSTEQSTEARPRMMDPTAPPDIAGLATGEIEAPTGEEANEMLKREGRNWFYGRGLGATMLNVGACIIFPPYLLYLVFNGGMQLAGEEPLYVTDALPPSTKEVALGAYEGVVSVPGKVTSAVADEEFREK
jgi:hypothetical protein